MLNFSHFIHFSGMHYFQFPLYDREFNVYARNGDNNIFFLRKQDLQEKYLKEGNTV